MLGNTAPGTGRVDPRQSTATGATRTVGTRQQLIHADTVGSTVITAEIPAVPLHRSYGVLLPDGTVWYPGSKKRLPAPWPIRAFVWALAFVLVLFLAGFAVLEWHPSWLGSLRHTIGTASVVPPSSTPTTTPGGPGGPTTNGQLTCTKPPTGETCTLPGNSYTIVFTATTNPVFIQIHQEPSGTLLYYDTQTTGTTNSYSVTGAATFEAFAKGGSAEIKIGGKKVGSFANIGYAYPYTFTPIVGGSTG
jgi:hypothetical protein